MPSHFTGKEKGPLRLYLQSGELCRARLTSPPDLLTGYSYPVRLIDPDGCEIGDYYDIKGNYLGWDGKNDNYEMSRPVVDKIIGQQSIRTQREIKILIQNLW